MHFKIDENLPIELAEILQQAGHDAETVHSEKLTGLNDQHLSEVCSKEERVLVTLDIVALETEKPAGKLWIVEERRIRVRS